MNPPIDLVILTGFLGSGKTTLLADYLAEYGNDDVAIIVNEAGSVSLDDAILLDETQDSQLLLLANGCLCCRSGGELSASIETLLRTRDKRALPPLRQIIVETSGLAFPGPILREVASLPHINLAVRFIGLWDCTRNALQAERPESRAQVAATDTIVLTKTDNVGKHEYDTACLELAGLNPLARTMERGEALRAIRRPEPALQPMRLPAEIDGTHGDTIVWTRHLPPTVDWARLAEWIDNLAGLAGDRLLRVKGLVRTEVEGDPILVQGVGTSFSQPRRVRSSAPPFLVVIADRMGAEEMESIRPHFG